MTLKVISQKDFDKHIPTLSDTHTSTEALLFAV